MLEVSVIVPTRDRPDLLARCLESLKEQGLDSMEIIVVDDCSVGDRTRSIARDAGAVYIRQDYPQGPGGARNRGLERARGYVVAFIDDDCVASAGWLSAGLAHFKDGTIGGVEGRTEAESKGDLSPFSHYIENLDGGGYQTCNIFYLRDVLRSVGGFDPSFPIFREDADLAFRVMELGFLIPFEPKALVYHPPRPTSYITPLKHALRHHFDPLLSKRHPHSYQAMGSFALARSYYGAYLGYICWIVSIVGGFWWLALIGAVPWLVSQIYITQKACRGKGGGIKDRVMVFLVNLAVPLVRLVAVVGGWIRFGKLVT